MTVRDLAKGTALFLRLQSRRGPPTRVTAILTERCHLRCDFCRLWEDPDSGVSTETWIEVFQANPHLRWVNLSGGELFAKEQLDTLLDAIVRALPRLYLLDFPTAGQRPDQVEESVRALLATPLPKLVVSVSLDGDAEEHDRIRGVAGSFERGFETFTRLRRLRSARFDVRVGCTLTDRARAQAEGLEDTLRTRLPDFRPEHEVHYNLAHASGHYYRNTDFEHWPEKDAVELLASRRRPRDPVGWIEWVYGRLAGRALREGFPPTGCEAIRHTVFIAPDLTVHPCSIWDRPLGNLRDFGLSIGELVQTAAAKEAREAIDQKSCPGCFTPCEAVPAMIAHPWRSSWHAWRERGP